ncbi:MAG: hypothetical protein WCG48_01160 [Candidatus Berkelbacteria bacterium]
MRTLIKVVEYVLETKLDHPINIPPGITRKEILEVCPTVCGQEISEFLMMRVCSDNNDVFEGACCCPHWDLLLKGSALLGIGRDNIVEYAEFFCGEDEEKVDTLSVLSGRRGSEYQANCYCRRLLLALKLVQDAMKTREQPPDNRIVNELTSSELYAAASIAELRELAECIQWAEDEEKKKLLNEIIRRIKGEILVTDETRLLSTEPVKTGCPIAPQNHFNGVAA